MIFLRFYNRRLPTRPAAWGKPPQNPKIKAKHKPYKNALGVSLVIYSFALPVGLSTIGMFAPFVPSMLVRNPNPIPVHDVGHGTPLPVGFPSNDTH